MLRFTGNGPFCGFDVPTLARWLEGPEPFTVQPVPIVFNALEVVLPSGQEDYADLFQRIVDNCRVPALMFTGDH